MTLHHAHQLHGDPEMTILELHCAVETAKQIWKDPTRQDRVIQALIRQAAAQKEAMNHPEVRARTSVARTRW